MEKQQTLILLYTHFSMNCEYLTGIVDDSNIMCIRTSIGASSSTAIGATCSQDSNCLYNICADGVCTAPPMTCRTSVAGKMRHTLPLLDSTFLAQMLELPYYISIMFSIVHIGCYRTIHICSGLYWLEYILIFFTSSTRLLFLFIYSLLVVRLMGLPVCFS
jgi:hypothetical protein